MLILGEKEATEGVISVRKQGAGDKEEDKGKGDMGSMTIAEFAAYFKTLL